MGKADNPIILGIRTFLGGVQHVAFIVGPVRPNRDDGLACLKRDHCDGADLFRGDLSNASRCYHGGLAAELALDTNRLRLETNL